MAGVPDAGAPINRAGRIEPPSDLSEPLRAIVLFVAAAELGNFSSAAVRHGITPQAISKAMRQLEQRLGVRLFHRTTRRVELTAEGRALMSRAQPSLESLRGALEEIQGAVSGAHGSIRLSAPGAVCRKVLVPVICAFQQSHPGVNVELIADDLVTDLVGQQVDLAFRAGAQPTAQVVARKLFSFQHVICASPDYLRRHGVPQNWDDLRSHRCTGFRQPVTGKAVDWEAMVDGSPAHRSVGSMFLANETETELAAVLAGGGIGQIDTINAAAHLRSGALVPVLVDQVTSHHGLYMYYPSRRNVPVRLRLFMEHVTQALGGSRHYRFTPEQLLRAGGRL